MRHVLSMAAAAALFATGCGCDECDERSGSYRVTFREDAGDCGGIPAQLVQIDESTSAFPIGCTGRVDVSVDHCVVRTELSCNLEGVAHDERWSVEWNCDADEAEGTAEVAEPGNCSSVYTITYQRP
jgi:hypothetical protein